jgi:hypothetical protein
MPDIVLVLSIAVLVLVIDRQNILVQCSITSTDSQTTSTTTAFVRTVNRAAANQPLFEKPRGPRLWLNRLFGNSMRKPQ